MRTAALAACTLAMALAGSLTAEDRVRPKATIVLDAPAETSKLSIAELERELAAIPDLQYDLEWIDKSDLRLGGELSRPVQVQLNGRCNMQGVAPQTHEAGPFAWAHVQDGRVLPFVEVDCERIRGALFSVMWGEDFQHRDFLFARAMSRVLAHELQHVLEDEVAHHDAGLAKAKLSASSLIRGDAYMFSEPARR